MDVDPGPVLKTDRLLLRPWRDSDIEPLHGLNTDPEAMRYFPWTYGRERSEASLRRYRAHFAEHGFGPWVIELPGEAPFIGIIGLSHVDFEAHFTPAVEAGWRIAPEYQGRGYATEAARAAVKFAFEELGLDEIVAFCTPDNLASRRVMEKLGMSRDPAGDFDHPEVEPGHPLRRVVLYRIRAREFAARGASTIE